MSGDLLLLSVHGREEAITTRLWYLISYNGEISWKSSFALHQRHVYHFTGLFMDTCALYSQVHGGWSTCRRRGDSKTDMSTDPEKLNCLWFNQSPTILIILLIRLWKSSLMRKCNYGWTIASSRSGTLRRSDMAMMTLHVRTCDTTRRVFSCRDPNQHWSHNPGWLSFPLTRDTLGLVDLIWFQRRKFGKWKETPSPCTALLALLYILKPSYSVGFHQIIKVIKEWTIQQLTQTLFSFHK